MEHGALYISKTGIFFAAVFTFIMSYLFWWLFHVPKAVTRVAAKVYHSFDVIDKILVPVVDKDYSMRGVELACRIGYEQKAAIELTYILEVPMSMPLSVMMPDQEKRGYDILESVRSVAELHGIEAKTRLERSRYAGDKLVEMARAEEFRLVVMGIRPRHWSVENLIGKTSEAILKKLPCEVIIDAFPESLAPKEE